MSLRKTCRDIVVEGILKRAIQDAAEGGRLQLIVDESSVKVLNSMLKMGDLHAEGVTSVELIDKRREPVPELDAMYLLRPDYLNIEALLKDFSVADVPQHRQVHLCFTSSVPSELMDKLAEAQFLAPRIRSLTEAPLGAVMVQDRGFHFDMPEAVTALFPNPDQIMVLNIVKRLADVCRILQATSVCIRRGQSELCRIVARMLQEELSRSKPLREASAPPCQLLILDRSFDMAATLIHDYTYEASAFDVLDGGMLDASSGVVKIKDPVSGIPKEKLLSEKDPLWEELKHKHILFVRGTVLPQQVAKVKEEYGALESQSLSMSDLLTILRKSPEKRDELDRLMMHIDVTNEINKMMEVQTALSNLDYLEQDIACGVDEVGNKVTAKKLQNDLSKAFREIRDKEAQANSDTRLRLFMLYYSCLANISDTERVKLMEMADLKAKDQQVIMELLRTRLIEVPEAQRPKPGSGCVHKATKEQAARFKRNATSGTYALPRFEPRLKALLELLAEQRLSEEDFPPEGSGERGLRLAGACGGLSQGAPAAPDWSFDKWDGPGLQQSAPVVEEVNQRIMVFVLGGITYSELRSGVEVKETLPRGTEVLVGGTSLLTPRRLIDALRPRSLATDDLADLPSGFADLS